MARTSESEAVVASRPIQPARASMPLDEGPTRVTQWASVLAPAVLIAGLYGPSVLQMARIWDIDPDYSHGYLIPLFSVGFAYACWRRHGWDLARSVSGAEAVWGSLLIVAGVALHFSAILLHNAVVDIVSLILVLRGTLTVLAGRAASRHYAFPCYFLVFMAPLPGSWHHPLALAMQRMASAVSAFTFEVLGVPVYREGYMIYLPNDIMEVGAACSGLRGLMAIIALATAVAFLGRERSPWYRWTLIAAAPVVAIASNCIRVVLTGFIMMWFGAKWAQGVYHEGGGLLVIIVAALIVLGLASLLTQIDSRRAPARHEPIE